MRKHNRNIVVNFPSVFTIEELQEKNPDIVEITLRYKVGQAIQRNSIKKIGQVKTEIGRPKLVYVKNPVDDNTKKELEKRRVEVYQ